MTFLVNPAGRRKRAPNGSSRTKRKPPAGFTTWAAYMASIRPNPSKETKVSTTKKKRKSGGARKRRRNPGGMFGATKRRRSHRRAVTSTRRRVSRARRNPSGVMNGIVPFVQEAAIGAATVLAGKVIARKGRGMMKQQPGTLLGSLMEAGIGLAAGLVVESIAPGRGELVAIGGLLAPMETLVQQTGVPLLGDALGDDGFLLSDNGGVDLVSAYDDGEFAGYVEDGDRVAGYLGDGASSVDVEGIYG